MEGPGFYFDFKSWLVCCASIGQKIMRRSEQSLFFQLDYQPLLLCRVLDQRGFEHWAEPGKEGEWRIDVHPCGRKKS